MEITNYDRTKELQDTVNLLRERLAESEKERDLLAGQVQGLTVLVYKLQGATCGCGRFSAPDAVPPCSVVEGGI